eukprot:TRINITY_DN614_c0_g1_i15.p3 TRINITY_DN614_c0_g1~~TRINITY_DN614_c0_g1_i15.p3  ORF type:complete len:122 (-),score=19.71 TRINITY_DN614_c0_g1_i15:144-509(-)
MGNKAMYSTKDSAETPEEAIIKLPDGTIVLGTKSEDSVQSAASKQNLVACYKCTLVMQYPPGAPMVRCPACNTLNGTPSQQSQATPVRFTCPYCSCVQQVGYMAPKARCGRCSKVVALKYR